MLFEKLIFTRFVRFVALSNSTGHLVEEYKYDVYGRANTTGSVGNSRFFTGREFDTDTGLYYYRARYYSPAIGRFLQTDPIGYLGGLNIYAYVGNNPFNFIDPLGLDTYKQKRKIGGNAPRPYDTRYAHEFSFTTNPDGTVEHTYGWGNSYRRESIFSPRKTGDWRKDHPDDMKAAQEGLKNGTAVKIGDESMDPYVDKAFRDRVVNDERHAWWPANQCQTENKELVDKATELQNKAEELQNSDKKSNK